MRRSSPMLSPTTRSRSPTSAPGRRECRASGEDRHSQPCRSELSKSSPRNVKAFRPALPGKFLAGREKGVGPTQARQEWTFDLSAEPQASAVAREILRSTISSFLPDRRDDVLLVATELVTNSVRHARFLGRAGIRMILRRRGGRLGIEVRDPGPCFDPTEVGTPEVVAGEGRGLSLVGALADEWGVFVDGSACVVWAEFDSSFA
jgi:anti-sigma regulatory factor (Ser/Thr protein kinase)